MPSVPSSKETPASGSVCPHAGKMLVANRVDKVTPMTDADEANRSIQLTTKNAAAERKWIRPDLPSRCKWSLGASKADSPHQQVQKWGCGFRFCLPVTKPPTGVKVLNTWINLLLYIPALYRHWPIVYNCLNLWKLVSATPMDCHFKLKPL